jgi:hypothetical protein
MHSPVEHLPIKVKDSTDQPVNKSTLTRVRTLSSVIGLNVDFDT